MSSVYTSHRKSCLISCYNFNKQTFIETQKYILNFGLIEMRKKSFYCL